MQGKEGCSCCRKHLAGIISAILFLIIFVAQLLRIFMGWSLMINGDEVPVWGSWIVAIIAIIMTIWNFKCCCCKRCHGSKGHMPPRTP